MPVSQKDIAREVGVSQAVVSDVLHNHPRARVSLEKRRRILEAAQRLSYHPNASAQALRSRQSHQIAYMTTQGEAVIEIGVMARGRLDLRSRLLMRTELLSPTSVSRTLPPMEARPGSRCM